MEVQNKQTIIIDLRKSNMIQFPYFTQYDTNVLEFFIKDKGVNADLASVTEIVVNYKRKDNVVITRTLEHSGNVVTYTLGAEEMKTSGMADLSLSFFEGTKRLSTAKLKVYIRDSLGPSFEGGEGLPLLQELFLEVGATVQEINDANVLINEQEETRQQQEESRQQEAAAAIERVDEAAASAKTNQLAPVANFAAIATTYPNPSNGDEVQALDDGKIYRRQDGNWKYVKELTPGPVSLLTQQLADKATKAELQQVSLSFKESYDTLAALQTAYPSGDAYNHTVKADGMIYTYANSVWASTGILANGTGIADETVTSAKLGPDVMKYPFWSQAKVPDPLKAIKKIELYDADKKREYHVHHIFVNAGSPLQYYIGIVDKTSGSVVCAFNKTVADMDLTAKEYQLTEQSSSGITGKVVINWSEIATGQYWYTTATQIKNSTLHPITYVDKKKTITRPMIADDVFVNYPFHPGLTNTLEADLKGIKRVELYGADKKTNYFVYQIIRNALTPVQSGVYIARMGADGTTVEVVASSNQQNVDESLGVYDLYPMNNSGITGKIWIDWSLITNNINKYYTNPTGYARSGLHPLTVVTKPLESITPYPFQPSITTLEESLKGIKRLELYGADKNKQYFIYQIIRNALTPTQSGVYVARMKDDGGFEVIASSAQQSVDESLGVYSLYQMNNSGITGKVWIDWSFIPNNTNKYYTNPTGYNRSGLHPVTLMDMPMDSLLDKVEIILPPKIPAVVGRELNIYFDNIIETDDLSNYFIDVVCDYGKHYQDFWTLVPDAVRDFTLTINIYKNRLTLITSASTTISVQADTALPTPVDAIFIGDSTTEMGKITGELLNLFGSDLVLNGTRGTAPNLHEGRSAWTSSDYITQASRYSKPNNFFNPATSTFDFSYYMTQTGFTAPDFVVLNVTINNFGWFISDDVTMSDYNKMIASIKAYSADIKILIALTLPPAPTQDAFGGGGNFSGGTRRNQKYRGFHLAKRMITEYKDREAEGIYLAPININLDTVNNFPFREEKANARSEVMVKRYYDNVHPADSGFNQVADTFYCVIKDIYGA